MGFLGFESILNCSRAERNLSTYLVEPRYSAFPDVSCSVLLTMNSVRAVVICLGSQKYDSSVCVCVSVLCVGKLETSSRCHLS